MSAAVTDNATGIEQTTKIAMAAVRAGIAGAALKFSAARRRGATIGLTADILLFDDWKRGVDAVGQWLWLGPATTSKPAIGGQPQEGRREDRTQPHVMCMRCSNEGRSYGATRLMNVDCSKRESSSGGVRGFMSSAIAELVGRQ